MSEGAGSNGLIDTAQRMESIAFPFSDKGAASISIIARSRPSSTSVYCASTGWPQRRAHRTGDADERHDACFWPRADDPCLHMAQEACAGFRPSTRM